MMGRANQEMIPLARLTTARVLVGAPWAAGARGSWIGCGGGAGCCTIDDEAKPEERGWENSIPTPEDGSDRRRHDPEATPRGARGPRLRPAAGRRRQGDLRRPCAPHPRA